VGHEGEKVSWTGQGWSVSRSEEEGITDHYPADFTLYMNVIW
jgi:hypothetical protein